MKSLKKVLAGALSLALIVGACFAFTGCKLSGKEYAYAENATITLITKIETAEDGTKTITETKDLTMEEYYLYSVKGVALDKLAENSIAEAEKEAFAAFKKTTLAVVGSMYKNVTFKFSGSKVEAVNKMVNEATGETRTYIMENKYEKTDNGYVMIQEVEEEGMTEITETHFTVDANDNVFVKFYSPALDQNSDIAVGEVLAYNLMFSEIKD